MSIVTNRNGNLRGLRLGGLLGVLALLVAMSFSALTAQAAANTSTLTITNPTMRMGQVPMVNGTGYAANELVTMWLTAPDQTVMPYGSINADEFGNITGFSYVPTTSSSPANATLTQAQLNALTTDQTGVWYITAVGQVSGSSSIASFTVIGATMSAKISSVTGDQVTITYNGANFFPGETVSLWLTDSTGNVTALGRIIAATDGSIPSELDPTLTFVINTITFANDGTTAPYMMTAHGDTSSVNVIANVSAS